MNIKKLLPFESYTLTTKLSMAEISTKLAENVHSKNDSVSNKIAKEFTGEFSSSQFKIQRIITYRNSFLPVIKGKVSTTSGFSDIKIIMRPSIEVIVFMCIWLVPVTIICTFILIQVLVQWKEIFQQGLSPMLLIPFGMFIFGSLLFILPFKMEAKKSKDFLHALFSTGFYQS